MKAEELSIIGVILLLFGITWILLGSILVLGFFSLLGQLLLALGILASLIGSLMLYLRWYNFTGPGSKIATATIQPDRTPASFLKKCPNCGRELPIATERCDACGTRI